MTVQRLHGGPGSLILLQPLHLLLLPVGPAHATLGGIQLERSWKAGCPQRSGPQPVTEHSRTCPEARGGEGDPHSRRKPWAGKAATACDGKYAQPHEALLQFSNLEDHLQGQRCLRDSKQPTCSGPVVRQPAALAGCPSTSRKEPEPSAPITDPSWLTQVGLGGPGLLSALTQPRP